MRGFVLLLFLLLKVHEAASFNSNALTSNSLSKRSRLERDEMEEGQIVERFNPRKLGKRTSGFSFDFFPTESVSEANRLEILANFVKFDQSKIDEILDSDFDIFGNEIWSDLIKLKNYKAIKYILMNHFNSDEFHCDVFEESIINGSTSLAIFLLHTSTEALKAKSLRSFALACDFERYKILKAMKVHGFDPNGLISLRSRATQLHLAVKQDNLRLTQALIKFPSLDLEAVDSEGNTPLFYVKSVQIAKVLIETGVNRFAVNRFGVSAVEFISRRRLREIVSTIEPDLSNRLGIFLEFNQMNSRFTKTFNFKVGRQNVLEDSFNVLNMENSWYKLISKYKFKVQFALESGIDMGGLTREWMSLLIERFFVPRLPNEPARVVIEIEPHQNTPRVVIGSGLDYAMLFFSGFDTSDQDDFFTESFDDDDDFEMEHLSMIMDNSNDNVFYNAPFECVDSDNKLYTISPKFTGPLKVYKFIGSVIAKAFVSKIPLKVKLVPSIMKLIMGKTLTFEDLKDDDPMMYRSMAECLEPDFDFKGAQYTLPSDESVFVDAENVLDFLNETAIHSMYYRNSEQINELIIGFRSIIDHESLRTFFSSEEVSDILMGDEMIDRSDLRSVFELRDVWMQRSEIFFEALDRLEPWELIELIRFITGINGLPFGGVKALGKKLIVFGHVSNQYIRSSTCNYHLSVPNCIITVEALVEALRISLASTPEFNDDGCCI